MNEEQKKILLEKAGFKCQKCGFYSPLGNHLLINNNFGVVLCNVCNIFCPKSQEQLNIYLNEKVDWHILETFRNFAVNTGNIQKKGMVEKSKQGKIVSRPAFGYKMRDGILIQAENADEVREIFEAFANKQSLNSIANAHNMSVNGIKKILKNFTYIGKVKFDNQLFPGKHQPILSTELFNRVQQRFENLSKE